MDRAIATTRIARSGVDRGDWMFMPRSLFWILCAIALLVSHTAHGSAGAVAPSTQGAGAPAGSSADVTRTEMPPPGMVLIPAGQFWMGRAQFQWLFDRNTEIERDRLDDGPAHQVYLDSFFIDTHEVTHEEYFRFLKATGGKAPWYWPKGEFPAGEERFPVYNVNWEEARAYCAWAGKRLPTEAEWEKAARGGLDRKRYAWGDDDQLRGKGHLNWAVGPVAVGSFPPNGFGLYDVAGNVWEWTSDWYERDYYSGSPDRNPKGPETGTYKVIRGSGWTDGYDARNLMVSHRSYVDPATRAFTIGIRCVK
jgi:formylglycine-generating enzyme required for sulfatase activity